MRRSRPWRDAAVKSVALDAFPPACREPAMMLDLGSDREGEAAADFVPYREEANRGLVEATLRSRRNGLPPSAPRLVAEHPRTLLCAP